MGLFVPVRDNERAASDRDLVDAETAAMNAKHLVSERPSRRREMRSRTLADVAGGCRGRAQAFQNPHTLHRGSASVTSTARDVGSGVGKAHECSCIARSLVRAGFVQADGVLMMRGWLSGQARAAHDGQER